MTDLEQAREAPQDAATEGATVIRGLFGRDMIYLAFWGLQIIAAAALTPLTTRLMGSTAFGQAAASIAVTQLLNSLFGFSLYTGVQRVYARAGGDENARYVVTLSVALSLVTGAVTFAAGPLWCPLIGLGHFPGSVEYAVLWAIMTAITGPALGLIRSRDDLRGFVLASFAQSILAQLLALGLVVAVRATAAEYMLGQLIGELITAIIALDIARPKLPRREHVPMLKDALRFSTGLVPGSIAGFLFDASDRIVIHGYLGATAVSRYSVARNLGGFVLVLLQLVSIVWMPRLFALASDRTRVNVLAGSRDGLYMLTVTFAIAVSAASPLLLFLWAPPSYDPQGLHLIMALIAASGLPFADSIIYNQALTLEGRTRRVAVNSAAVAVLNLGLNLVFVPILGIDGSAGATLLCYVLRALGARWQAGRSRPRTNWRPLLRALGGVGVCLLMAAVPASGPALAIRGLVAVAATAMFAVQLKVLIGGGNGS